MKPDSLKQKPKTKRPDAPSRPPPGDDGQDYLDWRSALPRDYREYLDHTRHSHKPPKYRAFALAVVAVLLSLRDKSPGPLHHYLADAYDFLTVADLFSAREFVDRLIMAGNRSEPWISFNEIIRRDLLKISTRKGLLGAIDRAFPGEEGAKLKKSGRLSKSDIALIKADQKKRKSARAAKARAARGESGLAEKGSGQEKSGRK